MKELTPFESISVVSANLIALFLGVLILINTITFIYFINRIFWWFKKGRVEYENKTKEKYFYPHKLEYFWGAEDNGFFYFVFAVDAIIIIAIISLFLGKIFI